MKITYERDKYSGEDANSMISTVNISDMNGKTARIYPENHTKDSEKVSKIFDILERAKKEIEEVLNG